MVESISLQKKRKLNRRILSLLSGHFLCFYMAVNALFFHWQKCRNDGPYAVSVYLILL